MNGYRKKEGADWKAQDAELHDTPTLGTKHANSGKLYETTALALDGPQKGTYYGSVTWGLKTDAAGVVHRVELAKGSEGVPSQSFLAAAKQWNVSTAQGTLVTRGHEVPVFDLQKSGDPAKPEQLVPKLKLAKDVVLHQGHTRLFDDVVFALIEVDAKAAAHAGATGWVRLSDVKDKGDGKPTLPLPHVDVKATLAAVKLYQAADQKDVIVELARDTRLRVLQTEGDMHQIEVVDGPQVTRRGWIARGQLKDDA